MEEKAKQILEQVNQVIIGKEKIVEKVLMAILARGHILLDDVPGVGKTTLALSFSKVLGLDYKRIQFTSDSVPSDVVGFSVYDKNTGKLSYVPGAVMTNLLLADEINRTSSKTQSALLEVMEEGNVTVDGETRKLEKPFVVIATQNPVGSAGTQMLPSSQLDRFMVRLQMGYPDFKSQVNILKERDTSNPLDSLEKVVTKEELLKMQQEVKEVYVADEIYEYITRLTEQTRVESYVRLGVSPRGALALCNMVKSYAFVSGRDYVIPEDVIEVFPNVYAHRLILEPKARMDEVSAFDVIDKILKKVAIPTIEER